MINYTDFKEIKEKLGEKADYKEFVNVQKYLDENPNLLLTNLYYNEENWDQFEKWKFDNEIKNKKVFAVVYKDNQMQIDYLKIEPYKFGRYTNGLSVYNKDQLFLTLEDAKKSLLNYRKGYIYTDRTKDYINSIEKDKKELIKEYYGKSNLECVWFNKVKELNENKAIEKIYEVYTEEFLGAWYLIKDIEQNRYIVKHKTNDVNTKFGMNDYLLENDYERIESKELDITQYDLNTKQKYGQMIFNYLIEFKNKVEKDYFKLGLNTIDIIEKFLEDYNTTIYERTKEYISPLSKLKEDLELQECFIRHVKFDIKCNIRDELNSLNFTKNNAYINEENMEEFICEFTQKAIYGEKESPINAIEKIQDSETTEDEEEEL